MNISSDESLDNSPVDIPLDELTDEVLRGVIESYVLREGTEYGARDFTLQEKVDHVLAQLRRRDARIVYNPQDQTVDIVTKNGGRR
jgi:uncharacterized protein